MPSLTASVADFCQSVAGIFISLLYSLLAVFQSVLALGQDIFSSVLRLAQSLMKLALDLFQGVTGFILSNIVLLFVLGGVYYFYNSRYSQRSRTSIKR